MIGRCDAPQCKVDATACTYSADGYYFELCAVHFTGLCDWQDRNRVTWNMLRVLYSKHHQRKVR